MVWKVLPAEPRPPIRKATGTIGRIIPLRANYYEVTVKDWEKTLVHYDVVIKEPGRKEDEMTLSKARKLTIFEGLKKEFPALFCKYRLAYDGMKSAVSTGIIPQFKDGATHKVRVTNNTGKTNVYHIILKVVNKTSLKALRSFLKENRGMAKEFPATEFQLIEIMFRHTPSVKYQSLGQNSFFSFDNEFGPTEDISSGMVAGQGFFASLRPAQWKDGSLLLNVDVAHAVFYKEQSVLEFMAENGIIHRDSIGNRSYLNKLLPPHQKRRLKDILKDLKVRVTHARVARTYKIIDVLDEGADKKEFKVDETKSQTVQKYFQTVYPHHKLLYEKLNLIRAAPDNKTVYLPIECCVIAKGQKVKKKQLGSRETAEFISFTAQPPNKRLKNVNDILHKIKALNEPMMQALEFAIEDKPLELKGRVLPPPTLEMVDPKKSTDPNPNNRTVAVTPFSGKWDVRDKKFYHGADIVCWEVLNYDDRLDSHFIQEFVNDLIKLGGFRGMKISKPGLTFQPRPFPDRDLSNLKSQKPNLELLLVILPSKTADLYAKVKKCGDRTIHTVTQCVLSPNVKKKNAATIGNLLFKINAKMGGINNSLGAEQRRLVLDRPVMIMGADVNHPPASDRSATPSVAAVVASMDRHACKYAVEVRHQTSRKEMIEELQDMTKSLLISFYRKTGHKPERIIMYRDGVSESQFLDVLKYEMNAMRAACLSLQPDYKPGITFIVVQKRHHTRFFPVNERDGVGRNKNVPPGTVVDTAVTHPEEIDFFLCSHEGIQGTSKPTHYRVLWDDNDFTMDQLQCFSYAVCHLYARCSRSVSIPTPAYYAHWAAYRGKIHLHELCGTEIRSRLHGEEKQQLPDNVLLEAVKMDGNNAVNCKMYFL